MTASLDLQVAGDPGTEGAYRLEVRSGTASCERVYAARAGGRTLGPRGLALLYAGVQSSANLRSSGHLQGGDAAEDLDWDALFGGRQLHVRDYF